jgi:LmbE family N-acetylglucosaminyl deacetylase
MPITDQERIAREQLKPRILELWRALAPLQTVVSFMNTGAHPDDETSGMLAAFSMRDGIDISYACSTRGEGGQNDIGTESAATLGTLRTAEMERACDVLGLRMYWHSETPDDKIFDFGFSKSGVETLKKWGRDRTIARFVDILRLERPDIICPTFLNVPGQHGHHRAMTESAYVAMDLAADSTYTGSTLEPWQVKKLYLPAWSGISYAYDDDLPPPSATLTVSADGVDPVTGWSFARIGQQSRAFHKTQAMGTWVAAGDESNRPLHLARSTLNGPNDTIFSGLPYDLRALGHPKAQGHIDAARAAFPDYTAVLHHASAALKALEGVDVAGEHAHKIMRKREQLSLVIRIASGAEIHTALNKDYLLQNDTAEVHIEQRHGCEDTSSTRLELPEHWTETATGVALHAAELSDPYPPVYLPNQPKAPCVILRLETYGVISETRIAFETPPLVLPNCTADVTPLADVVNIASDRRDVQLRVSDISPQNARASFAMPPDWTCAHTETGFTLTLPKACPIETHSAALLLDGTPASTVRRIEHNHISPRAISQPANIKIAVIDVALPKVKVGYIGGGLDRVDYWLDRIGMDVTPLTNDDLQSDALLAQFDSIVIGIFAMKFREGLADQMPRLHAWVENGGTLLTLYHRPWDNWDKDITAPKMLEIGQPSLRWRVTDEAAKVTHLCDHPILSSPNKITPADWQGWHKERGLYFAKSWDTAYTPILEMSDPDEEPHLGSVLSADIGKGRHTHCALILHIQMEKLVPGAFRLMVNFLAKRS